MIDHLLNKIHNCEALSFMKQMPDGCVDLVLTDPPYGIGRDRQQETFTKNPKHKRKEYPCGGWDDKIPSQDSFNQMFRVGRNHIVWGGNYFVKYLTRGHMGWIVWDKGQHGLSMSDCELAYSSFDVATRVIVLNRGSIARDGAEHPTQKPVSLFRQIIERHTNENDIVFDPFIGSGTTAVACVRMGRQYIGCEISEEYCKIAEKRIQEEKDKYALFNEIAK